MTVVGLWRSMEGEGWMLVGLYGPNVEDASQYASMRTKAQAALNIDFGKWTLPVQYKLTVETVE